MSGFLPEAWRGANRDLALWQLPLILTFSIEPGPYVSLLDRLMGAGGAERWWLIYPLMMALALFHVETATEAEFFIGMLVLVLPLSWRPKEDRSSRGGFAADHLSGGIGFYFPYPVLYSVADVCLAAGFPMWFSMTYAGWSLNDLRSTGCGFYSPAGVADW